MYKKASDQASKQVADKADKWNNIGSLRPIQYAYTGYLPCYWNFFAQFFTKNG